MAKLTQLLRGLRLNWLANQEVSVSVDALENGIVLLDSDGNYLMDSEGHVLYAATEIFTVGGAYFATADGTLFGVPA